MRIVVTFLLNAGLNFAVGLVVASLLGPAGYGRYAVLASTGALLATGLFEWLRLSTARFYGDAQQQATPALRPTLDRAYAILAAVLISGAVLTLGLPERFGFTAGLIAAVVLTAIANGFFDFRTALSRARFRDRDYVLLVIGKGGLGLACAALAAVLSHEPAIVLAAQAFGTLLATLPVRRGLAHRGKATVDRALVRRFAAYGVPIVAANVLFQSILLMNRSAAAAFFGYDATGHLSLATDIELRILLAMGAATDVLLFQIAVRSEALGGREAAAVQVRANMVNVAAILLLVTVGFASTLPAFAAIVVPPRFRDGFVPLALAVLPGIFLFCLGQFAINPVFQMAHRTLPIIVGALVSAAADACGLLLLPHAAGTVGIAVLHSSSLGLGVVMLTAIAWCDPAMRPSTRDLSGVVAAGAVMAAALWPLQALPSPWLVLAAAGIVGPFVYGAVLLLLNVGAVRPLGRSLVARFGQDIGSRKLA